MNQRVLFITPPFTQLNTPYPATAYLKGFLNTKNINIYARNSTTEYKLGNVVRLDNNLFALIEPATLMLKKTNDLIKAAEDGDSDAILDNMGW